MSDARQTVMKTAKASVLFVRILDVLAEGLGEIGNAALELVHGAVELTLIGFVVGEEAVHEIRYLQGFGEREFAGFAAVLIEDGDLGVLKNRIAGGVSGFEFLLNFGGEFVGGVLGLPPAAGEAELVADGAIGDDALAAGVGGEFGDQGPAAAFSGFIEQVLKRSLETQFVSHGLALEMLEILEIRLNQRVVGGELKHFVFA